MNEDESLFVRSVNRKRAVWMRVYLVGAVTLVVLMAGWNLSAQEAAKDASSASAQDDTVYQPTAEGLTPPKGIYTPNPEYSDKARKKKLNGTVIVTVVINADGTVREAKITRSLEASLDQKAIEAVKKWKFQPATKDGKPVAVRVPIEVDFRLY